MFVIGVASLINSLTSGKKEKEAENGLFLRVWACSVCSGVFKKSSVGAPQDAGSAQGRYGAGIRDKVRLVTLGTLPSPVGPWLPLAPTAEFGGCR